MKEEKALNTIKVVAGRKWEGDKKMYKLIQYVDQRDYDSQLYSTALPVYMNIHRCP